MGDGLRCFTTVRGFPHEIGGGAVRARGKRHATAIGSPDRMGVIEAAREEVILMFAGFKSRWTMPFAYAASSPSAIWMNKAKASSAGIRPRAMRSCRVAPSTIHHQKLQPV